MAWEREDAYDASADMRLYRMDESFTLGTWDDKKRIVFSIRVENYGSIPAEVRIFGPDGIPASSVVMLRPGETLTETHAVFAGPDKQGETATFRVGEEFRQPYVETTFTIPEA